MKRVTSSFWFFLMGIFFIAGIFITGIIMSLPMLSTLSCIPVIVFVLWFSEEKKYIHLLTILATILVLIDYARIVSESKNNSGILFGILIFALIVWVALYFLHRYRQEVLHGAKQQEVLNSLLENTKEGILIVNASGEIILTNPIVEKMFGYTNDELKGTSVEKLIPDHFQVRHKDYRAAFGAHPVNRPMMPNKELLAKRKYTNLFPVTISLSHFRVQEMPFVIAFIIDITDKSRVRERLHKEQHLAQTYFELAPVFFVTLDSNGIVTSINSFGSLLLGSSKEDIVGKNWFDSFLVAHSKDDVKQYFKRIISGEEAPLTYENNVLTHTNGERTISWRNVVIRDDNNMVLTVLSAGVDITDREKYSRLLESSNEQIKKINDQLEERVSMRTTLLEDTLQQLTRTNLQLQREVEERKLIQYKLIKSQQLHKLIAHNFPEGIISVIDKNMNCVFLDGQELKSLGLNEPDCVDEAMFSKIYRLFIDKFKDTLTGVFRGHNASYTVAVNNKAYAINTTPLPDKDGNINEILLIIKNMTKQKNIEHELVKAIQKERDLNIMKSRFVAMASHEFRTPLSIIKSSTYLLENYSGDVLEREKGIYTKRIKQSVNNLTNMLNDFVLLGKIEDNKVKAHYSNISVKPFIDDVLLEAELIRKEYQVIEHTFTEDIDTLFTDEILFKGILMNLLGNAIKYSAPDGKIKIDISATPTMIRIQVSDDGMGIPSEDQRYIFKRFYRAQNVVNIEGTGIGLNLVKKYIRLLKGTIDFRSQLAVGTVFTVSLPLNAGAQVSPIHKHSVIKQATN